VGLVGKVTARPNSGATTSDPLPPAWSRWAMNWARTCCWLPLPAYSMVASGAKNAPSRVRAAWILAEAGSSPANADGASTSVGNYPVEASRM